jgi:hypothetical protein
MTGERVNGSVVVVDDVHILLVMLPNVVIRNLKKKKKNENHNRSQG